MRRLLMLFFVVFFLGLVPVASAAPLLGPSGSAPSATGVAGGGFSLAAAVNWALQLWETVADAVLPLPGVTNGSCVDPDGSSCHSH